MMDFHFLTFHHLKLSTERLVFVVKNGSVDLLKCVKNHGSTSVEHVPQSQDLDCRRLNKNSDFIPIHTREVPVTSSRKNNLDFIDMVMDMIYERERVLVLRYIAFQGIQNNTKNEKSKV